MLHFHEQIPKASIGVSIGAGGAVKLLITVPMFGLGGIAGCTIASIVIGYVPG